MRHSLRALALAALAAMASTTFAQQLNLFNGVSLQGWNAHGTWTTTGGMIASTSGDSHYLLTSVPFGDFSLQFEYNEAGQTAAKLRLWTNKENNGGLTADLDYAGAQAGVGGLESETKSAMASVTGGSGWHKVEVQASHGSVAVKVDGMSTSNANGIGSRAGYIGFETNGKAVLQVKNVHLTPLNYNSSFGGGDLTGWKSIAHQPDSKGGVGHTMEKTFTFGLGGGSSKPHEAKWTVRGGAIHGEDGPGGLENATQVDDAILHIVATVKGGVKQDNFVSVGVRAQPGQMTGGYSVGIGPYAGAIDRVVTHGFGKPDSAIDETVIIAGRTMAIYINGTIATLHIDPRPESSDTAKGARVSAGGLVLTLPNKDVQLDVKSFSMLQLGKSYGAAAHAAPPPPPPVAAAPPPAQQPAADTAAVVLIQQQQQAAQQKDKQDQQKQQKVASLMGQALAANDPVQQQSLYGQVVQIDPSNAAAVQGFKEAQAKAQTQQAAVVQAETAQQVAQTTEQSKADQTNASLAQAQGSFLAGHLSDASNALSVAERLSPGNPLVRDLRARIGASMALRSRLYFLGGGAGALGALTLLAMWWRRRRLQRYPILEVTRGLDSGRHYPLDKDTVRIGAVAQDGAQKNDIVVRDVEHAVSRFHCEIVKKDGVLYLTDLKSYNGTRINGKALEPGKPHPLRKGNKITLANSLEMEFGYDRRDKQKSKG